MRKINWAFLTLIAWAVYGIYQLVAFGVGLANPGSVNFLLSVVGNALGLLALIITVVCLVQWRQRSKAKAYDTRQS